MITGETGLELIKEFEGLRLTAYLCPAQVWTIGYGHTAGVRQGDVIIEAQADAFLRHDLAASELAVGRRVTALLNQNQFDALVSFTFNLGAGNLSRSSLLQKLNAGDYAGAAEEFLRWNRAGGKPLAGLSRRRAAERALFLTEVL
mgnify:CR=1 FL=1